MKKYLVGGAVRDKIMGLEPKDFDYVLVNTNEAEVLSHGYIKISNNFPVYSHPKDPEAQFALARTETKVGTGYNGFKVKTDNVLLEEDLFRRDFTMNAMALDENGQIIDPFGGQDDIKNKVIRHVGEHFIEDPLRIIRTARFQARLGFTVYEDTKNFISKMLNKGMLAEVHNIRIVVEFEKAISENYSLDFIRSLEDLGILEFLFKTLDISKIKNKIKYLQNSDDLSLVFGLLLSNQEPNVMKNQKFVQNLPNRYKDSLMMAIKSLPLVEKYSTLSDAEKAELFMSPLRQEKNLNYCLSILGRYYPTLGNSKILEDWEKFKKVELSTATNRVAVIDKLIKAIKI